VRNAPSVLEGVRNLNSFLYIFIFISQDSSDRCIYQADTLPVLVFRVTDNTQ
jgi:hypothetical protein